MLTRNHIAPPARQSGITLLESMVAIVVMALGILGLLGIQMRTLADTQTAVRRAQAIRLIEDLSERIRANPNGLGNLSNYTAGWGDVAGDMPNCDNGCTADTLAKHDIAFWKMNVQASLPLGDANVFLAADDSVAANRRQLGVMISWRANERLREGDDAEGNTAYTTPFIPFRTGAAEVSCPVNHICHLQYIQPSSRCTPYTLGGAESHAVYCP